MAIIRKPVDERGSRTLDDVSSIRQFSLTGTFHNHLDLADATGELGQVIPSQSGCRDLKLLRSSLRVPDALSQNTSGRIESLDKAVPVNKVGCLVSTLND